jgi:hypothetical protein
LIEAADRACRDPEPLGGLHRRIALAGARPPAGAVLAHDSGSVAHGLEGDPSSVASKGASGLAAVLILEVAAAPASARGRRTG